MNDGCDRRGTKGCEDCFLGNEPMREMGANKEMMMPIHGPFVDKGFVFAPCAAYFRVHDDFGMRKEDVKVEGPVFIFVTKIISFVMGFRKRGVHRF